MGCECGGKGCVLEKLEDVEIRIWVYMVREGDTLAAMHDYGGALRKYRTACNGLRSMPIPTHESTQRNLAMWIRTVLAELTKTETRCWVKQIAELQTV